MKTLKLGDTGPQVKELQFLLNSHGITVGVDGYYGKLTKEAVKKFQLDLGLVVDGVAGPLTFSKLEQAHNRDVIHTSEFEFGVSYTPEQFETYLNNIKWDTWKPSLIVLHHTGAPSLAQRPNGFTKQHMINIKDYYTSLKWKRGPHIFLDEYKIWAFQTLNEPGTHASSFNSRSIGIEMLGNFDFESAHEGRGLNVIKTCVSCVNSLMKVLKLDKTCIRFHRDDPKTSKTCPGKSITKEWILSLL